MNKIKILLITIIFLSAASICRAQEKDTLEVKLAKLEAATKAEQSPKVAVAKPVCKKKTLAERIDELEAQQKKMQEVDKGVDTRISALEVKLVALETQSKQQPNEALLNRITELESKVQQLQVPSEPVTTDKPKVEKNSVSKVDSKVDSRTFAGITESEPIITASVITASEVKSDALPVEPPVIKATKLLTTPPFQKTEDVIGFEVTADYFGKYIWRGQNLSDDPVFQPGATLTIGGFTAGFWGSMDTTKINNENEEFTEYDWSLDYSGDVPFVKGVGYSVGVINYYFPSLEDTTEVYWGFGFDLPLSPSVTVYHDVDDIKGTYASFGIGHSIEKIAELAPDMPIGMEIGASLGWGSKSYNKGYWGSTIDSGKLNDLALSLSFPVEIGGWTVTPSLNYVTIVNGSIRKTDTFNQASDYFFAGIGISKSF